MELNIEHRTRYEYAESVNYTIQQLRLTPRDGFGQRVKRWDIRVNGHLHRYDDPHGNIAHTLVLDSPHHELSIVAVGEVETGLPQTSTESRLPLEIYLRDTPLTQADQTLQRFANDYAAHVSGENTAWVEDMMRSIVEQVPYVKGSTAVDTTAASAFAQGKGVCQDHAHIFLSCCRHLGMPARYVSGYLFTADGSLMESHAWADVWLNGLGWRSYDVSNGCLTNGVHVRLAVGLDYREACPVSGVRSGGGKEHMDASVRISPKQMQQSQQ
ncbi:transglutaminase family protein [Pseudomethylobacillus aquaticus]|uniref:Transglutaminase family protein n=1 Tax=Pseudomethylobacillus aquaticus TaxID=2676064 RepID=A0A3N0V1D3_9PROT|nr:transglutaminase family protein [Pseudomethylobacillus aquaticus]ROH86298.1 transglutaminase family protein [Pseudomethylobacillus aquaticus]